MNTDFTATKERRERETKIIEFLKQEGRHYSKPSVMMGLLNLVRERVLTRFTEKGEKNWKYVVRR